MRPPFATALAALVAAILLGAARLEAADPVSAPAYRLATHVRGYVRKDGTYVRPHERRDSPGARARRSSVTRSHASPERASGAQRDAHGRIVRSEAARDEFMREHPCPSTGRTSGPCPGYVVDHIRALKHGGADTPSNMQWQTVEAAKAKDKIE